MSTTDESTTDKVEGSIVDVIHVDNSGTDPVRTVLAVATKGDLGITIDESTESFDPGNKRRTERFRTANQVDVEVTQAIATDTDALSTVGIVDSNGNLSFAPADRDWGADEYLELGYNDGELDYSTDPGPSEYELVNRFADCEVMAGDVDPSATPPTVSFTVMVEGDVTIDASAL